MKTKLEKARDRYDFAIKMHAQSLTEVTSAEGNLYIAKIALDHAAHKALDYLHQVLQLEAEIEGAGRDIEGYREDGNYKGGF